MDNSSKNRADDDGQGEHLQQQQQQQQRRRQSSTDLKPPEERPYRRRIKPPPAKVHHVHPAHFRRFVQRRTGCSMQPQPNAPPSRHSSDDAAASPSTSATMANLLQQQPPAGDAIGDCDRAATDAGCIDVSRRSMQEAYMAWCSSNDVPLSPGTLAELSFTEHPYNDQR